MKPLACLLFFAFIAACQAQDNPFPYELQTRIAASALVASAPVELSATGCSSSLACVATFQATLDAWTATTASGRVTSGNTILALNAITNPNATVSTTVFFHVCGS